MAELIEKGALIEAYDKLPIQKVAEVDCGDAYRTRPLVDLGRVNDMICSQPTTTEAEIRAKAIKDFLDKLLEHETENWVDHQEYGITWRDLELIAEQLKERE